MGNVVVCAQAQLGALMSILKEHISHMEREQLGHHQAELTSFFLSALAFRAEHGQVSLSLAPPPFPPPHTSHTHLDIMCLL